MKSLWLIWLLPCSVACASVLGLDEAELDENSDGPVSERGGTSSRGGSSGAGTSGGSSSGGSSSGGACSFTVDDTDGDRCLRSCWNSRCCESAATCFAAGRPCDAYVTCFSNCAEDEVCQSRCATRFPNSAEPALALSACTIACGCVPNGEAGAGGGGGADGGGTSGGVTSTSGGVASGGVTSRGGTSGGAGEPCTDASPSSCLSGTRVKVCIDGQYQDRTCAVNCAAAGFQTGPCSENLCRCGEATDSFCAVGTRTYCDCYAALGGAGCTQTEETSIYVSCHLSDELVAPVIECFQSYAAGANTDCEAAWSACVPA